MQWNFDYGKKFLCYKIESKSHEKSVEIFDITIIAISAIQTKLLQIIMNQYILPSIQSDTDRNGQN